MMLFEKLFDYREMPNIKSLIFLTIELSSNIHIALNFNTQSINYIQL